MCATRLIRYWFLQSLVFCLITAGCALLFGKTGLAAAGELIYLDESSTITLTILEHLPGLPAIRQTIVSLGNNSEVRGFDCSSDRQSIVFSSDYRATLRTIAGSDGVPTPRMTSNPFDGYQLYLLDLNTYQIEPLTRQPDALNYHPDWSPDNQRVVYMHSDADGQRSDLYILDTLTGEAERLTQGDPSYSDPDWSPVTEQIVATSRVFLNPGRSVWRIVVLNLDGTSTTLLAAADGTEYSNPHWSPDGTQIVFRSGSGTQMRIFVMNYDGSNLRSLTDMENAAAVWSPDGVRVIFDNIFHKQHYLYFVDPYNGEFSHTPFASISDPPLLCWLP